MLYVAINTKNLDKAIRLVPQKLKTELGDAFDHIGRKFLKTFKETRLEGPPGIKGRRHGILKRFIRTMLVPYGGIENMGTAIYTESKIAKLHETGGIVEAQSGSLAVPLSMRREMYTAGGALRTKYRYPGRLKNVGAVLLRGKRFLAQFIKRSREIKPLYVLKNRVIIKPRLGFYDTWKTMENTNIQILNRAAVKALKI